MRETSRVLAVRGLILPSTPGRRHAARPHRGRRDDQRRVTTSPSAATRIEEVFLQPANVQANPEAIRAILEADMVVVGPGSLLHQRPAQPAGRRHPPGAGDIAGHQGLRLQRRHPARRDGRLLRQRPLRDAGAATSAPASSTTCWPTTTSRGPLPEAWHSKPVIIDTPRRRRRARDHRRRGLGEEPLPPRFRQARGGDHAAVQQPQPDARPPEALAAVARGALD